MSFTGVKMQMQGAAMANSMRQKANSIVSDGESSQPLIANDIEKDASSKKARTKSSGSVVREDAKKNRSSFGASGKAAGAKSEGSVADDNGGAERPNLENFKKLVYLFVARDSDMFVFENHIESKIVAAKFTADIYKVLTYYQDEISDAEERPPTHVEELPFNGLKFHMHYDTIYYGLVAQGSFTEENAQRLLNEVKEIVSNRYKGNVMYMKRQTNLERNCLAPFLNGKISKILDKYTSSISSDNLNKAFAKVEEVKEIAGRTVTKMAENMSKAEDMVEQSQDLTFLAKDFNKNAETLEKTMQRQAFWACSRPCIMMFVGIGLVIFILYWVITSLGGGGDEPAPKQS